MAINIAMIQFISRYLVFHFILGTFCANMLMVVQSTHAAGTYDYLYDFNSDRTLGSSATYNQRRIAIPRKNGIEISAIKTIICSYPGSGASGAAGAPHASMARWAYDNGIAFYSVGYAGSDPTETVSDLTTFAGVNYVNNVALMYAPLIVQGGSYGSSTAMAVASTYATRVVALYSYHKGSASYPEFPHSVPAHISFGEMDSSYSDYNTNYHWQALAGWVTQGGAPRSFQFDRESAHTEIVDRPSHFQLFVESMLALRHPYQQGVVGRDPALGLVTLNPANLTSGWRGEHLFSPSNPDAAAIWDGIPYAQRAKDWDSPNLKISPAASFDRENAHMHSWFPDAKLAAAWRARAGLGARQILLRFPLLPSSDAQDNTIRTSVFNTDQTATCELDPGLFTSATRVEFYDGITLVGEDDSRPFTHSYAWVPGDEGMHVLSATAVNDATKERRVSGCRIVRVTSKQSGTNTAPTISEIPVQTIPVGTSNLQIPFTIGDAETATGSLGLLYVKESYRLDSDPHNETLAIAHTGTFAGAGANRTLNLTITDTAKTGVIWAVVQVNDGDLQANSYIRINVVPTSAQAPIFVPWRHLNSSYGTLGEIAVNGGWSKEMSFRVHDPDTAPEDLIVTATTNNQASIPDNNVIIGGYGEYRTLRVKPTGTAYTSVTITVSDGTNSATSLWRPTPVSATNTPPVLNILPDATTYIGEAAATSVRPYDFFTTSQPVSGFTALAVSAVSNNQTLLPNAHITIIPAGYERTILCQPAAGQTGSANVTVTVTDEGGLTTTDTFTLNVGAAVTPVILEQPKSTTVPWGSGTVLSVNATGGEPKTYQWYTGTSGITSSPVTGGTSASLALSGLTTSGDYWVRVTNSVGSADSAAASVAVIVAPAITSQPSSVQIYSGANATFSVSATGEQLTYQWYEGERGFTNSPVNGATSATFTSPALTTTKKYWARVSNIAGSEDSYAVTATIKVRSWVGYHDTITIADGNAANVTAASVSTAPGASTSLKNFSTGATTGVTLTALLNGSKIAKTNGNVTPLTGTDAYNAFNGIISFQNGSVHNSEQLGSSTQNVTFTFSGLDPSARYSVAFYAARNAFTTLNRYTVSGADSFLMGHSNGVGDAGDSDPATADVATGTGSTTNGYLVRWVDIAPGADGSFAVEVRTHTGTSAAIIPQAIMFEAFSNTPPAAEIQAQPEDNTIPYGSTTSLSVTVTGTGLSYQWFQGESGDTSNPVAGATSATLTTPPLTANATFWVRITNPGGTVNSQSALVTVAPELPEIQTTSIQPGTSGEAFSTTLAGWGGSGPLTWSVASGQLPPGLALNATTGVISGIPAVAGTAHVVIRATDSVGRSTENVFAVDAGKIEWSAYHDTITTSDGNAVGVTYGNSANADSSSTLKDFATNQELTPVISITSTIGTNGGFKDGSVPAPDIAIGADAAAIFNGIISFGTRDYVTYWWDNGVDVWDLGLTGQAVIRFYRLDPAKRYDVALFAARLQYDSRTKYTIGLASNGDPLHSAGSIEQAADGSSVAYQTGQGALEAGRVARWTNIVPTAEQPGEPDKRYFSVTVTPLNSGAYPALLPQGIRVRQIGSAQEFTALPAITSQPVGVTIEPGQTANLSATVIGLGLSFQWYRGTTGDTSNPVSGANSATFSTPAISATTSYWLRVSNGGGSMDSQSATVTINGPSQTAFEVWCQTKGLNGQDARPDVDIDGDGLTNLFEFAFGENPTNPTVLHRPFLVLPDTMTMDFTFHRGSSDLVYILETSLSLALDSWVEVFRLSKGDGAHPVGDDLTVEVPTGGAPRKFLRMRIEE